MRWTERIAALFRPSAKLSTRDASQYVRPTFAYDAGTYVTTDSALQVSAVWACIDAITRAMAPAPWRVFEVNGRRRNLRPDDSLAYLLNTRPNPATTAIAFRESLLWSCMAAGGNGYAEIQYDLAGRPVALWPIEPDRVEPHSTSDGSMFYRVSQFVGGTVDVEPWRIYHLRGPSISGLVGDNIIYRASKAIAIASAAQQFAAAYFSNGTVASGVLRHPKKVDPKAIERLRNEWWENHAGPRAAHKPLFLEEGMEWDNIAGDPEKTQLTAVREFSVQDIARYWGVPLTKLNFPQAAQGYGTNVESIGLAFISDCLRPWKERLEQEADYKLFPQRAPWRQTEIDLSHLRESDSKTNAEALVVLKKGGILTHNQCLERLGENTIGKEGDVYLVESNMTTLDRIITPPAPPAPAPQMTPPQPEKPAKPAPTPAARDAAVTMFADAFDRHARRVANRRADLKRELTDEERGSLRARCVEDCATAMAFVRRALAEPVGGSEAVESIAGCVADGEPPKAAAERLLIRLLEAA